MGLGFGVKERRGEERRGEEWNREIGDVGRRKHAGVI